jgi:hypothetical protein
MPAKKSGQNQPHANKEERPADNHNERRIAREIAALSHSISEEERTSRDAQERQDNGKKFREYLTLLFIILTTIGVFIQAFVFKGQLHEMEKAYGPIEKSAIAAKEAADAARDAVKQSEKTAERQLRAYISSVTINEGTQRSVPGRQTDCTKLPSSMEECGPDSRICRRILYRARILRPRSWSSCA